MSEKFKMNPEALEQFMAPGRIQRFNQVLSQRSDQLTVVLDGVTNYHNISAVIRSADAFGLKGIHLVGQRFSFSKGITMGTERWMDLRQHKTAVDAVRALKDEGYTIVVTAPEGDARSEKPGVVSLAVHELPFQEKLALVFGNECRGVQPELFDEAKYHAFIPMIGFVESLNISVACAITLYSSMISSAKSGRQLTPLSEEQQTALRADWLVKGMRRSELILQEIGKREESLE